MSKTSISTKNSKSSIIGITSNLLVSTIVALVKLIQQNNNQKIRSNSHNQPPLQDNMFYSRREIARSERSIDRFWVSTVRFGVSTVRYWVSTVRYWVSTVRYWVSTVRFWVKRCSLKQIRVIPGSFPRSHSIVFPISFNFSFKYPHFPFKMPHNMLPKEKSVNNHMFACFKYAT